MIKEMGDYHKLQEQERQRQQQPHPHVGVRSKKAPAPPPPPQPQPPTLPSAPLEDRRAPTEAWQTEEWNPYEHPNRQPPTKPQPSPPPPYTEEITVGEGAVGEETQPILRPAEVDPRLKARFGSCDKTLRRLLPIALLLAYTLLGGVVFHLCESRGQSDSEIAKGHRILIDQPAALQLEKRMTEIVLDRNYSRTRRTYEVREALLWYLRQLNEEEKQRWDFVSAVFYSMTLYTTIGYGDTPPKTTGGRVLTVIYAIIGIPLCLAALIELGDLVGLAFSTLWSCVRHGLTAVCRNRRRTRTSGRGRNQHMSTSTATGADWEALPSEEDDDDGRATAQELRDQRAESDADLLSFPLSALIVLTICWLFMTALLFWAWEYSTNDWTFGHSLYFVFISISTIGLGDFVPGSASGKLCGIFFLLVGLALFSSTFAVIQNQFNALQNSMQREIDTQYQTSQGDTGDPMATDERGADRGIEKITKKLPWSSRLLYKMMPAKKKENLKEYYQQKAAMVPKGMQTDDYLWAMTQMSKSYLKEAAKEKQPFGGSEGSHQGPPVVMGASRWSDDAKSRDDVNSLVAMCDYALPYGEGRRGDLEY